MRREEVARRIHWAQIIWLAGIVNIGAMLPQLYTILTSRKTENLNMNMFWIYFLIQICFSIEGYFTRNRMLMWCLGLSALVSLTIIVSVNIIRSA